MSAHNREWFFRRGPFDPTNAFEHIVDAQQWRAGNHLENPRRLGLDLFAYQRVKSLASREIDLDTQALFQQSLGRHNPTH
jgi:hypothetical protein